MKKTKRPNAVRVTVRLSYYDWTELVNFIEGDIANMDEGCPVAKQMLRICETIRNRYSRINAQNQKGQT